MGPDRRRFQLYGDGVERLLAAELQHEWQGLRRPPPAVRDGVPDLRFGQQRRWLQHIHPSGGPQNRYVATVAVTVGLVSQCDRHAGTGDVKTQARSK